MGAYSESHSDDVCEVKFHPKNPDILASGSTDGLINIFDISKKSDYDALEYCMNTESSVQKLNWYINSDMKDCLSCITHTNDLHLYDVYESELICSHDRESIAKKTKVHPFISN